jgi:hypothetical protein
MPAAVRAEHQRIDLKKETARDHVGNNVSTGTNVR